MLLRAFAETPLAQRSQRTLSGQRGRDAENGAIQEDLPEAQADPVPYEKTLERGEGGDEGEDVDGEQLRDARFDVCQLCKAACELCEHINDNVDVRIRPKQPKGPGR